MKSHVLLLCALLGAFASGCQRKWVKSEEIPGTWSLSEDSRQLLDPGFQKAAGTLVFRPDKTFAATEVSAEIFYGSSDKPRLITGTGTWSLTYLDSKQTIYLALKTAEPPPPTRLPGESFLLYAERKDSIVILYYFIGDPDGDPKVVFVRKSN
jgi:hypothetical protein